MTSHAPAYGPVVPDDAVALVTGASRGIGRAIALRFAATGRPVGLLARSAEALEAVAAEVRRGGGASHAVVCDVADAAALREAVKQVADALGPIRVLVNNAGTFLDRPFADITLEEWEAVLCVNATAAMVATQAVWPMMVASGGGIIVNIASRAAIVGYAGQSAYCASKAAMLGWARALALEAAPHNIRVHTIGPGGTDTALIAGTPLAERLAGQALIRPEDVAEAVQFCVSMPSNVAVHELFMSRRGAV